MMIDDATLERAVVARIPVLVKARAGNSDGRRVVEVEASTEEKDADRDYVMQSALMGAADQFVANGHLDIDHFSEFGDRLGIPDPASYIVGRPLSVRAASNGRTFVEGEIRKSLDGTISPQRNRYDDFWLSLQSDPPVQWFASIYGFPTDYVDCTSGACPSAPDTRFIIKGIDWRSLAFTRQPKNTALKSAARIVTAKSFLAELVKSKIAAGERTAFRGPPTSALLAVPDTMDDVYAASACKSCGLDKLPSLVGYRRHFAECKGLAPGAADVCAHAMMYRNAMTKALRCTPLST